MKLITLLCNIGFVLFCYTSVYGQSYDLTVKEISNLDEVQSFELTLILNGKTNQHQIIGDSIIFNLNDAVWNYDIGNPLLPLLKFHFQLKDIEPSKVNCKISEINLIDIEQEIWIEPYIPRASKANAESFDNEFQGLLPKPNTNVYSKNIFFPEHYAFINKSWIKSDKNTYCLNLFPYHYNPYSKAVRYIEKIKLIVSIESNKPKHGILEIMSQKNNVENNYKKPDHYRSDDSSYVIITSTNFVSQSAVLSSFITHKESIGFDVHLITENDFEVLVGQYPNTRADKIRAWLIQNKDPLNIKYVLLIGNPNPEGGDIPMKMLYPRAGTTYYWNDFSCPSDSYFSNLSGNWDLDGDGLFGEQSSIDNDVIAPDPQLDSDEFAIRWEGKIQIDDAAGNRIALFTDDGCRVWINNELQADKWYDNNGSSLYIDIEQPGIFEIKIEYYHHNENAFFHLFRGSIGSSWFSDFPTTNLQYYDGSQFVSGGLNASYYNDSTFSDLVVNKIESPENGSFRFRWMTGDDGPDGVNFDPEILVGRIPFYNNNYSEVDSILQKTIEYQIATIYDYRKRILLPMKPFDSNTPNFQLGEQIKDSLCMPSIYTTYRIYDEAYNCDPDTIPCNIENVLNAWDDPFGAVTWATHGSSSFASGIIGSQDTYQLQNDNPAIVMMGSCYNGYPEDDQNLGFSLLKNGAVATVSATRVSWYGIGTTFIEQDNRYIHGFCYFFTENILKNQSVGRSLFSVKNINNNSADFFWMNSFDFNLYGDASISILPFDINSISLPLVQTYPPLNITPHSAVLQGEILSDGGTNIYEKGFYIGRNPNPEISGGLKVSLDTNIDVFESIVEDLLPETQYYVKAYAINFTGTSFGIELAFITPEETICSPLWSVIPNLQFNMQVIAQIIIDDAVSTNPDDVLGAFVGDECRGIASPIDGSGLIFLSVGSNETSGEQIELKIWNSSLCDFCEAGPGFTFENLSEVGTFDNPYQVSCITDVDLNLDFGQGYTWFSENLTPEDAHPNAIFNGLEACNNDRLIGQSSFSVYYNGVWNGTINAVNPFYSYRMKLCEGQTFTATAPPAEITPIQLNAGYTWLGYLPQACLPINDALANIDPAPAANDRLIGQSSFALFTGSEWIGSLTTLCPGDGYVIKLANTSTLLYPEASPNGAMNKQMDTETDSPIGVLPEKNLQHSMTVLGQIELPAGQYSFNTNDRIYAYINDRCVGMANPMKNQDGLVFLSVGENSDEAQQVSFKIWLDDEQKLYEANELLTFMPLKGTGAYENPFKFTIDKPVNSETDWFIGEPYPNPFSEETIIPYTLNESATVAATIYNSTGQQRYHWQQYIEQAGNHQIHIPKGQLSSGIYSVKILISNSNQLHHASKTIIVM